MAQNQGPLYNRYVPGGLRRGTGPLERHLKRARRKWKRRSEQDRPLGAKIKLKHTYRIRARNEKGILTFFKTRTKMSTTTLRRLMARGHVTADRISL